jgi:hypothetical protein
MAVQIAESQDSKIEGFIAPLVIDEGQFNNLLSRSVYQVDPANGQGLPFGDDVTFETKIAGESYYIRNCKCYDNVTITEDKLFVGHRYGGGASDREGTVLVWNGKYYKTAKSEYTVDVLSYSDVIDIRRAVITDKKIFDITKLQRDDVRVVWIHLVGYDRIIPYEY